MSSPFSLLYRLSLKTRLNAIALGDLTSKMSLLGGEGEAALPFNLSVTGLSQTDLRYTPSIMHKNVFDTSHEKSVYFCAD